MCRPLAILAASVLFAAASCPAQEDHAAPRDAIGTAEFFVEEFIPNRIHVKADAPEGRRSTTDALALRVSAEEMFGQAAGGRTVKVSMRPVAIPFSPEGFDEFTFGDSERKFSGETVEVEPDTLGEDGVASMTLGLPAGLLPPAALKLMIQATVLDSGGRGVTSHLERTFDPYPHYLGVRLAGEGFPKPGGEARFDVVAVKPDGTVAAAAPRLDAEVFHVTHNSVLRRQGAGYHFETSRELHSRYRAGVALQDGRGTLTWTPGETGSFLVRVADPATSASTSRMFHVSTGEWDDQPWSLEKPENVEVAPDRAEYAPGETARILVKAPFAGTLVLTLEQDRVLTSSVFQMPTNTLEVPVPLSADHMPNVYATAVVVRPVRPAEKWMPHRAVGTANIAVSPASRRLAVEIGNPAEVRPDSKMPVRVSVADASTSAPAKSLVTLWAVDEGVLSLTGFDTPDPIGYFYGLRRLGVLTADNYRNLMPDLVRPASAQSHTGGDGMPGSSRLSPIAAERVKPVVLWAGTRETDTSGVLIAVLDVPRHMGRLRVMAVAADGPRFGAGESNVFVRSPLMVQDNLPRFLAPGDRVESGFVVFNNSDAPVSGTLTVKVSGPLGFEGRRAGDAAASVSRDFAFGGEAGIAARGQTTVRVRFDAAAMAGVARVAFSAKAGAEQYSGDTELPVRPASPHRRLSGLEQLAAGSTTRFTIPSEDFLAGTTSGSLVVSGMPQLRLAAGLRYLVRYPYGCLEQTVSGAFPLLKLRSLAAQGALEGVVEDAIAPMVQSAIDRILMMQNWSGGFTMWPGSGDPWPWASVYAAHFLVEAKREGFVVPTEELNSLLNYLGDQLQSNDSDSRSEQAYAAWVLAIAGRPARDRMELLAEKRAELSGEARAMLAASFMVVGDRPQAASLLQEAGAAAAKTPVTRGTSGVLRSERRQTAVLLLAWLEQDATAPDVPVLAKRLYDAMNAEGHWGTTQDTAFALLALGRHADVAGVAAGEFQADLRMGDETHTASNASPFVKHEYLGNRAVEATLRGPGTGFAFWTVEGVPQTPPTTAISKGLTVSKRLLSRKGVELKPADGLKQGDFVVVEIAVSATQPLDNVIIEDLLPAGFEVENKNLKSAEAMDEEGESGEGMSVQRSEARDDRMVAFVNVAAGEKRVFRYAVRAVTPGRYVMPPVQASCMYDPDVQALQPGGTVVVR